MLEIQYTRDALKDLRLIGHVASARVMNKISAYADAPSHFSNQVKKLQGEEAFRLRVGDYRVLFDENGIVLRILRVGHRREIYR